MTVLSLIASKIKPVWTVQIGDDRIKECGPSCSALELVMFVGYSGISRCRWSQAVWSTATWGNLHSPEWRSGQLLSKRKKLSFKCRTVDPYTLNTNPAFQPVLRTGSGLDPDSIRSVDPDPMTHKNRKKLRNMFWSAGCYLLRAEGFSCWSDFLRIRKLELVVIFCQFLVI